MVGAHAAGPLAFKPLDEGRVVGVDDADHLASKVVFLIAVNVYVGVVVIGAK